MPAALGFLWLGTVIPLGAQTQPATITVNAATTLTSFIPVSIFGVNAAYWIPKTNNDAVSTLVKQAGNYFIRFPGGSASDTYHWNGTGPTTLITIGFPAEPHIRLDLTRT